MVDLDDRARTRLTVIGARRNVIDTRSALDERRWRSAGWSFHALGRPLASGIGRGARPVATAAVTAVGVGRFRELVAELAPDVVFGTEAEAGLVGDVPEHQSRGRGGRSRRRQDLRLLGGHTAGEGGREDPGQ